MITEADVALRKGQNQAGYSDINEVVGQESRKVLYAGRPILFDEIGPPSIILRNQIVQVHFQASGLKIVTEARALDRGAVGDRIRVMNLSSRSTLFGQVKSDGSIHVRTP